MKAPAIFDHAQALVEQLRAAGNTDAADIVAGLLGTSRFQLKMLNELERTHLRAVQLAKVRAS